LLLYKAFLQLFFSMTFICAAWLIKLLTLKSVLWHEHKINNWNTLNIHELVVV